MTATIALTAWAVLCALFLWGNHRWGRRREQVGPQQIPHYPPKIAATRTPSGVPPLADWTYVPVDLPSVPLSWAEQERLDEIERREFSGGAA